MASTQFKLTEMRRTRRHPIHRGVPLQPPYGHVPLIRVPNSRAPSPHWNGQGDAGVGGQALAGGRVHRSKRSIMDG